MPTPAQLVETVAEATGLPLATVVAIDRRLVMAGLRTKSGRGLSVASATPRDSAHLLTAILASASATEAAEAVGRYQHTEVDRQRSTEEGYAATEFTGLRDLPARHSFVDALAALIAAVAATKPQSRNSDRRVSPRIEVYTFTRATYGRIRIGEPAQDDGVLVEYVTPTRSRVGKAAGGDLEQSRRITERTIVAVARLFNEENDHAGR